MIGRAFLARRPVLRGILTLLICVGAMLGAMVYVSSQTVGGIGLFGWILGAGLGLLVGLAMSIASVAKMPRIVTPGALLPWAHRVGFEPIAAPMTLGPGKWESFGRATDGRVQFLAVHRPSVVKMLGPAPDAPASLLGVECAVSGIRILPVFLRIRLDLSARTGDGRFDRRWRCATPEALTACRDPDVRELIRRLDLFQITADGAWLIARAPGFIDPAPACRACLAPGRSGAEREPGACPSCGARVEPDLDERFVLLTNLSAALERQAHP